MKSTKMAVQWGGESDDETLADVMAEFRNLAPSASFVRYGDVTSAGWPVYEIVVADEDAAALADFASLEIHELDSI